MADEEIRYTPEDHAQFLDERKMLIDAARESAKTFDQAVLAFGSAVFGFSIAFVKDISPHPETYTLKWLGVAWGAFSIGLLAVLLSFLFSHQACMFEIDVGARALENPNTKRETNVWAISTTWCNYLCIGFLFVGLLCWSVFAVDNLGKKDTDMSNPPGPYEKVEKGYVPPRTPPPPPARQPPPPPPTDKK